MNLEDRNAMIRKMHSEGHTMEAVSKIVGLSRHHVSRIVRGLNRAGETKLGPREPLPDAVRDLDLTLKHFFDGATWPPNKNETRPKPSVCVRCKTTPITHETWSGWIGLNGIGLDVCKVCATRRGRRELAARRVQGALRG